MLCSEGLSLQCFHLPGRSLKHSRSCNELVLGMSLFLNVHLSLSCPRQPCPSPPRISNKWVCLASAVPACLHPVMSFSDVCFQVCVCHASVEPVSSLSCRSQPPPLALMESFCPPACTLNECSKGISLQCKSVHACLPGEGLVSAAAAASRAPTLIFLSFLCGCSQNSI